MDWKKIGWKILFPPLWLILLLSVVSTAVLIAVFQNGWDRSALAGGIYAAAFYTLLVLCIFLVKTLPGRYRAVRQKISSHPLGYQYMTDAVFKVRISLYLALAVQLLYSAFHFVFGVRYDSPWVGAMAVYYILLMLIRFLLLRYMRSEQQDQRTKYRRYRLTAVLMLMINLTLSGIVLNMIWRNESAAYSDAYVIACAAYTFYMLTVSTIEMIRYRKYHNPILSAAQSLRWTAALVSLLSLEASLLVQFGDDESFRKIMLSLTGAGIWIAVMALSLYMIIHATREIRRIQIARTEEI